MWPTIDGLRVLREAEASLVRGAIGVMVDQLVAESRDDGEPRQYGIDWFDQWDCEQRLWLLEQVTVALFTPAPPPPPAAIWEATIDTVFCQVLELIMTEIDETSSLAGNKSWRQSLIDAFRCQQVRSNLGARPESGRLPKIDPVETDISQWRTVVTQVADVILGVTSYQKAEFFRDGDIEQSRRFLMQKGLPADFLERIPPLRTMKQTQRSIDRILSIVCR